MEDRPMDNVTPIGEPGGRTGSDICPTCGSSRSSGVEALLSRLGITEEMVSNLKSSMQNVEIEQYLNSARDYLRDGSTKAKSFAKENPGKVAAGVAVLAIGAGLLINSLREKEE